MDRFQYLKDEPTSFAGKAETSLCFARCNAVSNISSCCYWSELSLGMFSIGITQSNECYVYLWSVSNLENVRHSYHATTLVEHSICLFELGLIVNAQIYCITWPSGCWSVIGEESEISLFSQKVVISASIQTRSAEVELNFLLSQSFTRNMLLIDLNIVLLCRLMKRVLSLPMDSSFPLDYATEFNTQLQVTCLCWAATFCNHSILQWMPKTMWNWEANVRSFK